MNDNKVFSVFFIKLLSIIQLQSPAEIVIVPIESCPNLKRANPLRGARLDSHN